MKKLSLNPDELRVQTFEPVRQALVPSGRLFTEQQYCTIGNPPLDGEDEASRTTCPLCCV